MEKQIIIIKPGSLKAKDKEKLTKAGNIVIEHEKPFEINYHTNLVDDYVYVNCCHCGDRIYLLKERLNALKVGGERFYCSREHAQRFNPVKK